MKKKIIFYQSISEIIEITKLLKKSEYGSCTIVVTGGNHFLAVIKKLKLKKKFGLKIYSYYCSTLKNPLNILKIYISFHHGNDIKKILSNFYDEAIFFNKCFDFVTPFFLSKLNVKNIFYINFYKFKLIKSGKINYKSIIIKTILKFIYKNSFIKINFNNLISHSYQKNILSFNFLNLKIKNKPMSKSKYEIPLISMGFDLKKKKVIYLDSNEEEYLVSKGEYHIAKNVGRTITELLDFFETKGYNIIIKKHGREKLSSSFSKIKKWNYIFDPFPIELYDLNSSDVVIGYISSGLPLVFQNNPKVKSISILKMLPSRVINFNHIQKYYKDLYNKKKVLYPKSIKEIKSLI